MDIIGPLPRTNNGNKYILTIRDYATRCPDAIPILNTEANTIGPLDVPKEAWVGYEGEKENISIHVLELRRCLEEMSELVKENVAKAQNKQ